MLVIFINFSYLKSYLGLSLVVSFQNSWLKKTYSSGLEDGEFIVAHFPIKRGRRKKTDSELKSPKRPKQKSESEKKRRNFACSQCPKEFRNNCDLQRHVDGTHLKLRPFKCEQCPASFALMGNLKKHIGYVHHNVKRIDHKVACPICGKIYGRNYSLTLHITSMHSQEKQFQCEYCGMKFAWKKCYERHIRAVHLQEKKFQCNTCSTMFNRKEHLRVHQKRHEREGK